METEERKPKRMQSILTPREKELERLKSLAVVSVLNKNFEGHTLTRPTSLLVNISPSSSLTTSNTTATTTTTHNSNTNRLRSNSTNDTHRTPSAEKEIDEDHLVTNSPVDTEKEDLEKRLSELEALYTQSMSDLNILKEQNSQQRELLVLQDKLISQMAIELEETSSTQQQPEPTVDINVLTTTQTHVADMVQELNELRVLKPTFESGLSTLLTQLQADDEKLDHLESIATQVQKTNTAQTEYIDTKVQTLLTQVLHKNEMINKLQQENEQQEKQIQALLLKSNTNSARSSLVSENARNSLRWKGNMLPPASPPPSSPLPPIPTATESSTTRSILSELSKGIQSSSDIVIEDAFDEAAYYKEFTDQLQQRLSTSKEIDELRVWEPSDYDEIQKKINSETWSLDDEQHKNTAFWKGMKKRLIK